MTHPVKGFNFQISNDNVYNVYSETIIAVAGARTYLSPIGGAAPVFPSDDGELIKLVSTSVGTVRVVGLDPDFNFHYEDVELTGVDTQTTTLFARVNNLEWRSKEAYTDAITATDVATGTKTYRLADVISQLCLDSAVSLPAGYGWMVEHLYSGIIKDANQQTAGSIELYYRPVGFAFRRPFRLPISLEGNSTADYVNTIPEQGKGPTDFYLVATASDATEVVARLTILLRKL